MSLGLVIVIPELSPKALPSCQAIRSNYVPKNKVIAKHI